MKRLEEIKQRAEAATELEAEKHYSLESGCDSWLKLKPIYQSAINQDIPLLIRCLKMAIKALTEYSDHENYNSPLSAQNTLAAIEKELA